MPNEDQVHRIRHDNKEHVQEQIYASLQSKPALCYISREEVNPVDDDQPFEQGKWAANVPSDHGYIIEKCDATDHGISLGQCALIMKNVDKSC